MSYNGVGLQTPRGSGTNGYVQRSLANIRKKAPTPYSRDREYDKAPSKTRKPNPEIIEHDRKREIEVQCLELQDKLEEEGYPSSPFSFSFPQTDFVDSLNLRLRLKFLYYAKS